MDIFEDPVEANGTAQGEPCRRIPASEVRDVHRGVGACWYEGVIEVTLEDEDERMDEIKVKAEHFNEVDALLAALVAASTRA